MVVICEADRAEKIAETLSASGETVYKIGNTEIYSGPDENIFLENIDASWP
jgi:phosphoribosylaminoimidazole (AIR) synthetase